MGSYGGSDRFCFFLVYSVLALHVTPVTENIRRAASEKDLQNNIFVRSRVYNNVQCARLRRIVPFDDYVGEV